MAVVKIIMLILGGLGALLIGMKMLSDNLTRLAHDKLKNLLGKAAGNRFSCLGIGLGITVVAQNSSFTTVMVVGLVNAGIMSLFQATAIIMGANVGTTLVAWIIALGGSKFSFTVFLLGFASVGAFMTAFAKKEKIKTLGNVFAGLGLLFVGLNVMSEALGFEQGSAEYSAVYSFLSGLDTPFLPIIFLLVGIAVTSLVQSSAAVNAIVITMAAAGLFDGLSNSNALFFIVIGTNVGTCVTALISSIGANANAKRAAFIHFIFNVFGTVLFMIVMLCWSGFADTLIIPVFPDNTEFQITFFHTLFNVVCAALFLPFVNLFVKLANAVVRDKKKSASKNKKIVDELDERLLRTPSVALAHLYEQTGAAFTSAKRALDLSFEAFVKKDVFAKEKVLECNADVAEANKTAVANLVKLSAAALSEEEEKDISTLHNVYNDVVRVSEIAENLTKYTDRYVEDNLEFSDEFLEMLRSMYSKLEKLFDVALQAFLSKDLELLAEVDALEDTIDNDRRDLVATHVARLNEGKCRPASSGVFINLVGNLERAADHVTFIAHSIEQK